MGNGVLKRVPVVSNNNNNNNNNHSSRIAAGRNWTQKLMTPSVFDNVIDCYTDENDNDFFDDDTSSMMNNDMHGGEKSDELLQQSSMDRTDVEKLIRTALRKIFIFESIDNVYIDKLVSCFVPQKCMKGDLIIQQYDEGEYMYFIESGVFDVSINSKSMRNICCGDIFGELALIYNAKRSATVVCTEPGKLWLLDRKTLRHFQHYMARKDAGGIADILKNVPLLKELDKHQLLITQQLATIVEHKKNDLIIKKGDIGTTFYIITEGTVACSADPFHSFSSSLSSSMPPSSIPHHLMQDRIHTLSQESTTTANSTDESASPSPCDSNTPTSAVAAAAGTLREFQTQESMPPRGITPLPENSFVHLSKGDWFGEIALLTPGSLRTANVVASSKVVKLLAFNEKSFQDALGSLKDIIDKRSFFRAESSLFGILPKDKIERAIDMFTVEKYSQGDVMCKCGDPVSRIMVMRSGRASIWKHPKPSELTHLQSQEEIDELTRNSTDSISHANHHRRRGSATNAVSTEEATTTEVGDGGMVGKLSEAETKEASRAMLDDCIMNTLKQFKMASFESMSKLSDTEYGEKEAKWRRRTTQRLSTLSSMSSRGSEPYLKVNEVSDMKGENSMEDESKMEEGGTSVSQQQRTPLSLNNDDQSCLKGGNFLDDEFSSELRSGDVIGVEAVTNQRPMNYTVIAQEEVFCFVLSEEDFRMLLESNGPLKQCQRELKEIDISELQAIDWTKLVLGEKIGSGTFGIVHLVVDSIHNKTYAMKVLDKKNVRLKKQERRVRTETKLLLSMQSPFICKCFGATDDSYAYYLLLEMLVGGELKRIVHPKNKVNRDEQTQRALQGELAGIPAPAAKFYAAALAIPLMYLHRRGIAYRDLKPDNVVLDHNGYPKLIDFGLSKQLDMCSGEQTYTMCGTPEYLAPEVIMGSGYNQAVDWWSLGVIIYEMMVGIRPFCDKRPERTNKDPMVVFENIVKNQVSYPKDLDIDCRHLISRLLTSKALRLGSSLWSFKVFEQHPWFENEVDWYALKMRRIHPPYVPGS